MSSILFDYQTKFVADFNQAITAGVKRMLGVAPTGSGKTVMATAIVKDAVAQYKRVLFVAHRDELITQAVDKLRRFGDLVPGIIKAGRDKDQRPQALVQVASVQTLHARAFRSKTMELPLAEIVVIDEAHHARARTYQQIVDAYPNAIVLGLTATPCRGDGRGLGNIFETLIECPQIAELIKLDRLVRPKIYAPAPPDLHGVHIRQGDYVVTELSRRVNTDQLVGDIVLEWLKRSDRRRTVGFAVDVAHSIHIRDELIKSGVRAEHLDGTTPQPDREAILSRLASGETEFVSNCQVLTEGFDLPDLGCIVLARPTKSFGLYLQMIGRGLRTADGKSDCVILDHAGAVHQHGLPHDQIVWTLDVDEWAENVSQAERKAKVGNDPMCDCPSCGAVRVRGMACDVCGWEPARRGSGFDFADGDLVEVGKPVTAPTYGDKLIFHAELRGYQRAARKKDGSPYADGWAAHKFKEKFGHYPPWDWNDKPALEPTGATLRWIKSRQIAFAKARAA
jgi:superfamily II DNA or RNA helicase